MSLESPARVFPVLSREGILVSVSFVEHLLVINVEDSYEDKRMQLVLSQEEAGRMFDALGEFINEEAEDV